MRPAEIRAHPYFRGLQQDRGQVGKVPGTDNYSRFWSRVLADITRAYAELDGARRDVEILGQQLNEAIEALALARRPVPVGGGTARPLTLSAQEAVAHALTRPRSELDEYVIYPNECAQAVIEELIDHGLAELHGTTKEQFESGDWWHLPSAYVRVDALAVAMPLDVTR